MKKSLILLTLAFCSMSCMKDFGGRHEGADTTGRVPSDFEWKTTRDVTATINMPTVEGEVPDFAVVRVYSTPVIAEGREIALGVLTAANPTFSTAFTVPESVTEIYVKTTLRNGASSVRAADVTSGRVDLTGGEIKNIQLTRASILTEGSDAPKSTSMPKYPTLPEKNQSDFDSRAVIAKTPASIDQLGASWASFAAAEYYIPAGAVIDGGIDLNGGFTPYQTPILYVKGKLTLSASQIGGTLAVLPGGEVIITGSLTARQINNAPNPAIYLFEGGKLTADNVNLSCESIVNNGIFKVKNRIDTNGQITIYNGTTGEITADNFVISNTGRMYNDGKIVAQNFEQNASTTVENCENGVIEINDMKVTNASSSVFTQKGRAHIVQLKGQGVLNIHCYTYVNELDGEGAKINIALGACLETDECELNNTQIEMASGALFIAKEYNLDGGGGNKCDNEDSGTAVFRITEKAVIETSAKTQFSGAIEVVYDNAKADEAYRISDKYVKTFFKGGAYLTAKQLTNIPATECNADKGSIEPAPEVKPEDIVTKGATFTYCFEDGWPWLCDYDMNDVVVPISVDRRMSADGSKVESITINWEVKASGAKHRLAMAVQLDQIKAAQIASVESTNSLFGAGPFANSGVEAGNDYAVIPFFNSINETQSAGTTFFNTDRSTAEVATTKQQTTIHFTAPVDVNSVLESSMNVFLVVNRGTTGSTQRNIEVHLPWFKPTAFGDVAGIKTILPESPYKYYSPTDIFNNGMMWGLVVPDSFRYPAESRDIRKVYTHFLAWAVSGGVLHKNWYETDVIESQLY